jgi:hypothetical protein
MALHQIRKLILISIGIIGSLNITFSQPKTSTRYFGQPIWTDSTSTIFFPTRYNEDLLSTNKVAFWGDYYANFVVYNFKTDMYCKLFPSDTYIQSFYNYSSVTIARPKNIISGWVFFLVKKDDRNDNGRIDVNDPSVLFVSNTKGENLKPLTDPDEDVVAIDFFEKAGFALIKVERSVAQVKFSKNNVEAYYRKVDLKDLSVGKAIEVN